MAIGDNYLTRNQLAAYLSIPLTVVDPGRDAKLDAAIAAASRAIEDHCRRQFNTSSSATARVYEPTATRLVVVDDFFDTASLIIQKKTLTATSWETALTTNNYELEPRNGVVSGQPGWPYRRIKLPYWARLYVVDRVQVTAKWGWAAVPTPVIQAAYIMAAQYFKLPDAPLGVAGFGSGSDGFSAVKIKDVPQAWSLLCPYVVDIISVA